MEYNTILERLHSSHYSDDNFSEITSSYWKEVGKTSRVSKKDGNYVMSGLGFGVFVHQTPLNYIKWLPQILLAESLLRKYDVDRRIDWAGRCVMKSQNRTIEFDCVKQMLTASLLFKLKLLDRAKLIAIIGDGYGFMTSLIKMLCPESTVIDVNLGRVLFFDVSYTKKVFPQARTILIDKKAEIEDFQKHSFIFLEAEKYHFLSSLPINLFINIASMQEMNMEVINTYFDMMRSSTVPSCFYSCNRIEKKLPDGTIIRFFDYPWHEKDEVIVDELCPWYQKYPTRWPPFWKSFDGPMHHRLVRLSKT